MHACDELSSTSRQPPPVVQLSKNAGYSNHISIVAAVKAL